MKLFLSIAILTIFTSTTFSATLLKSVAPGGKIEFQAIGRPSMLKIKGEGTGATADLSVVDQKISGDIKFDLNLLYTGIALRDEHMKEKYLQVKEKDFGTAVLSFKQFQIPLGWSAQDPKVGSWTFQATLRLHGVEKVITGSYAIGSKKMDTVAKFDIKLTDYAIDIPTYLGVKVADVVNVTVEFPEMKIIESSAPAKK
ncbi:MAG: YceI family protein [Bdellovibrio sp.]|nr:YceI family protein [Bdellovibrio sp.]